MDAFVSITKFKKGRITFEETANDITSLQKAWTQSTLRKVQEKSKTLKEDLTYETSITSLIVESLWNIVLFLITTDWFSRIITSKIFGYDSWRL